MNEASKRDDLKLIATKIEGFMGLGAGLILGGCFAWMVTNRDQYGIIEIVIIGVLGLSFFVLGIYKLLKMRRGE